MLEEILLIVKAEPAWSVFVVAFKSRLETIIHFFLVSSTSKMDKKVTLLAMIKGLMSIRKTDVKSERVGRREIGRASCRERV